MPFTYPGQYVNGLFLYGSLAMTPVVTVTPLDGGTVWTSRAATTPLVGAVPLSVHSTT